MGADMKSHFRAGARVCSGLIMVLLVIGALARPAGHPARRWAGRLITSSGILPSHCLSALRDRGRSWSGDSSRLLQHCWKVCRLLHRIACPIFPLHSTAQAGRWPGR